MYKGYSLAFSGGAARGLAHIGVYKYLEEQGKTIDEVAGTSMGAIVAALIAIGKTSEEIIKIAKDVNYIKLGDFDLKTGLIKGNKIEKKLEDFFGDLNIEETSIPLKIVATNIEQNETVVFTEGKIVDAVRASIAFPGVFVPKNIGGEDHVDGGLNMNLPVETLHGKNIIASSALQINYGKITKTKQLFKVKFRSGFIKNSYETLTRSVILLMRANENRSVNTHGKNVTLIRPDFGKLDILHFTKVDEFVKIGYDETKKLVK